MLLSVEITPEMKEQLERVKEHNGLSLSDVVRLMLSKQLADTAPLILSIQRVPE